MRALVKAGPGPGMVLREVPRPVCGPTDVLIRVHHAGVCKDARADRAGGLIFK